MNLLALLVSSDDPSCEILGRILPAAGIALERFSDVATALERLSQQRFDALLLDFEDLAGAAEVYEQACKLNPGSKPITIALVPDRGATREILSSGAHFILYKPLTDETVNTGLRAVVALLKRERRRSVRVPVQAPVELTLPDGRSAEGILLDLSETGMEVLTAEQQAPGALLKFYFQLPDGHLEILAHGQIAWAQPNGQNGIRFMDLDASTKEELQVWVRAATGPSAIEPDESVGHCTLSDLSLGGCYVETDSPFPEHVLVDLCLRADEMEVHTEGMVRITHPGFGMGVEFPSRTPEQRAQVGNLINFLRSCPNSAPELSVSPRALTADLTQYEEQRTHSNNAADELDDPLLELLRRGSSIEQDDFLAELRRQRSGEAVAQ
jgi:DNA-binding response OmpR family regulator